MIRLLLLISVYVSRLLSVNIYLTLKTINLQTVRHQELPDCYDFHIMVGDMIGERPTPAVELEGHTN